MRYLIVSLLPQEIDQAIRDTYQETFQEHINIAHLHLTYLSPFFLKTSVTPDQVKKAIGNLAPSGMVSFSTPQIFTASQNPTLVLPLLPKDPLSTLNQQFTHQCSALIHYDMTVYNNHQVPPFDPHISLSYNFTRTNLLKNFDYPKQEFTLSTPVILQESSPASWEIV